MNKIVFLDIDGPIIPVNAPRIQSIFRTTFLPESIEYLNLLCDVTGAQVVTNSCHNYQDWLDGDLSDDLVEWGLSKEFIHRDWRTIFPMIDYKAISSPVRGIGRLVAINRWIEKNGPTEWVCFDDRKFTSIPNLIHIENGRGIKAKHFNLALDILGELVEA